MRDWSKKACPLWVTRVPQMVLLAKTVVLSL
jgi:hypothetical protein